MSQVRHADTRALEVGGGEEGDGMGFIYTSAHMHAAQTSHDAVAEYIQYLWLHYSTSLAHHL